MKLQRICRVRYHGAYVILLVGESPEEVNSTIERSALMGLRISKLVYIDSLILEVKEIYAEERPKMRCLVE